MTSVACELQYSVEAEVSRSFAWAWRTDLANWNDPPAEFQLDGPFASGSSGTTKMPGHEPIRWRLREVQPETSFVIDMPLVGAVLTFEWIFERMTARRTRITQRIVLSGDDAPAYVDQVRVTFGAMLEEGMKRIVDAMVTAERSPFGGH
jgi:hypothetical protein